MKMEDRLSDTDDYRRDHFVRIIERAVEKMGISNVRLAFTVETAKETEKVLDAFSRGFLEGEESEEPVKDFTRGHFKRGVE